MSPVFILAWIPVIIVIFSLVGLVLIVLGVRGQPIFSSPRCAKCGYDLRNVQFMSDEAVRNCPECGNDLARVAAVSFGKWQRQPKRIVYGVALLLLPWALGFGIAVYARSRAIATAGGGGGSRGYVAPAQRAAMSTPALLANLKLTVDQPWDWQELEGRMRRGQLTQADVDAAFATLTAHITAKHAKTGRREPIHWADGFLKSAIAKGIVSPQEIVALTQAFYGTDPKLTLRSSARADEPFALTLNQHEPWNLAGMRQVWSLASITADGQTPLVPQRRYSGGRKGVTPPPMKPDELSASANDGELQLILPHALPPGEHEITITREVGVIDENATLRGLDGKPGTPDRWPSPVARWKSVVKRKVTVVPKGASVLQLVTDPNADPFKAGSIVVEQALTRPSSRGVEFALKLKTQGTLTPLVSYRIWIQAGADKVDYGTMVMGTDPLAGGFHSYSGGKAVKQLPADVKTIDLLFEVDESGAERFPAIESIWGKPHVIRSVKLERYDLSPNPNVDAPATQPR
jgi:hypothetical protein